MRLNQANKFTDLYHLLESANDSTIGMFPGAFKPPHRGHYATAAMACEACDTVYIIMSPKPRNVGEASKDTGVPEWHKYKGLLHGGKQNEQYSDKLNIQLAEVDRLTSASKMRQTIQQTRDALGDILSTALDANDLQTYKQNISEFIPESLSESDKDRVVQLLSRAPIDMVITADEAQGVWDVYIENLRTGFPNTDIKFVLAEISPIIETYNTVDKIYNEIKSHSTINLYTG